MPYKTIILEMLLDRPELSERLRSSGRLLSTMNRLAVELRQLHLQTIEQLNDHQPTSDRLTIKSKALEISLGAITPMLNAEHLA